MSERNHKVSSIGFYSDEQCRNLLEKDAGGNWILNFNPLNEGETKTSVVYMRNNTAGRLEQVKITLSPEITMLKRGKWVSAMGAVVEQVSRKEIEVLNPMETYKLMLRWTANVGQVEARKYRAGLSVTGWLTREEPYGEG